MTTFFSSKKLVRLHQEQVEDMKECLNKYPGLFENQNHVVRCAINYFLKDMRSGVFFKKVGQAVENKRGGKVVVETK